MSNIELLNKLLELTVWLSIKDYDNYEISICFHTVNFKSLFTNSILLIVIL